MGKAKGQDNFERINFLYQTSYQLLSDVPTATELITHYGRIMSELSQKTQTKLDPSIKRSVCKKCHILLYPGVTCSTRHRSKRSKHLVIKCTNCGKVKRFPSNPEYQLWYEKPEACPQKKT